MSASLSRFAPDLGLWFAKFSSSAPLITLRKRLLMCCLFVISFWLINPAMALAENAPELFAVHCAGCHPNGANIIRRGKNLKQKALNRHGYTSVDEIATLITDGKGLMSAYGEQLSENDINALANYVLEQAAINWKPSN